MYQVNITFQTSLMARRGLPSRANPMGHLAQRMRKKVQVWCISKVSLTIMGLNFPPAQALDVPLVLIMMAMFNEAIQVDKVNHKWRGLSETSDN